MTLDPFYVVNLTNLWRLIAVANAAKNLVDNYGGEARDCDLEDLRVMLAGLEEP